MSRIRAILTIAAAITLSIAGCGRPVATPVPDPTASSAPDAVPADGGARNAKPSSTRDITVSASPSESTPAPGPTASPVRDPAPADDGAPDAKPPAPADTPIPTLP